MCSTFDSVETLKFLLSYMTVIPYDDSLHHFMACQKERLIPPNVASDNRRQHLQFILHSARSPKQFVYDVAKLHPSIVLS